MGEQADHVPVLTVELQLHLRFVLLQVFRAHVTYSPSGPAAGPASPATGISSASQGTSPASGSPPETGPTGLPGTQRNDRRCSGHGPASPSVRRCSPVTYPLWRLKPYRG